MGPIGAVFDRLIVRATADGHRHRDARRQSAHPRDGFLARAKCSQRPAYTHAHQHRNDLLRHGHASLMQHLGCAYLAVGQLIEEAAKLGVAKSEVLVVQRVQHLVAGNGHTMGALLHGIPQRLLVFLNAAPHLLNGSQRVSGGHSVRAILRSKSVVQKAHGLLLVLGSVLAERLIPVGAGGSGSQRGGTKLREHVELIALHVSDKRLLEVVVGSVRDSVSTAEVHVGRVILVFTGEALVERLGTGEGMLHTGERGVAADGKAAPERTVVFDLVSVDVARNRRGKQLADLACPELLDGVEATSTEEIEKELLLELRRSAKLSVKPGGPTLHFAKSFTALLNSGLILVGLHEPAVDSKQVLVQRRGVPSAGLTGFLDLDCAAKILVLLHELIERLQLGGSFAVLLNDHLALFLKSVMRSGVLFSEVLGKVKIRATRNLVGVVLHVLKHLRMVRVVHQGAVSFVEGRIEFSLSGFHVVHLILAAAEELAVHAGVGVALGLPLELGDLRVEIVDLAGKLLHLIRVLRTIHAVLSRLLHKVSTLILERSQLRVANLFLLNRKLLRRVGVVGFRGREQHVLGSTGVGLDASDDRLGAMNLGPLSAKVSGRIRVALVRASAIRLSAFLIPRHEILRGRPGAVVTDRGKGLKGFIRSELGIASAEGFNLRNLYILLVLIGVALESELRLLGRVYLAGGSDRLFRRRGLGRDDGGGLLRRGSDRRSSSECLAS